MYVWIFEVFLNKVSNLILIIHPTFIVNIEKLKISYTRMSAYLGVVHCILNSSAFLLSI